MEITILTNTQSPISVIPLSFTTFDKAVTLQATVIPRNLFTIFFTSFIVRPCHWSRTSWFNFNFLFLLVHFTIEIDRRDLEDKRSCWIVLLMSLLLCLLFYYAQYNHPRFREYWRKKSSSKRFRWTLDNLKMMDVGRNQFLDVEWENWKKKGN